MAPDGGTGGGTELFSFELCGISEFIRFLLGLLMKWLEFLGTAVDTSIALVRNHGMSQSGTEASCHSGLEQSIVTVQCSDPIGFCHRWIIEGRVDEVLQGIERGGLLHDRLADVHNFRCIRTKTMHP